MMLNGIDNNNNNLHYSSIVLLLLLLLQLSPLGVVSTTAVVVVVACGPGYELLPGSGTGDAFLAVVANSVISFSYSGNGYFAGTQTILAGKAGKSGYVDGVGDAARFTDVTSMVVLPSSEDIIIADAKNYVLRKLNAATGQVTTFAGVARPPGGGAVVDFSDGPGNVSTFSTLGRLSVAAGRVYVAAPPFRLVTFSEAAKAEVVEVVVSTLYAPYCYSSTGTADGLLLLLLSSPGNEASRTGRMTNSFTASISPSGTFFILTDSVYHTIRRLDLPESRVSTIAGGSQGCLDATGTNALFNNPSKTLVTSNNSLIYIADPNNLAVRVMDLQTLQVWTLTGSCPPAVKQATASGVRIAIAVYDMVISSDETFLVVISSINGNPASIRLDTGFVAFLGNNAWQYNLFFQSLAMIPTKGSSCRACGQGTYSSNGVVCVQCSAGMLCGVGSGNQTQCPVGYSCANASSSSMRACASGNFCPAGSQNQMPCPAGYRCVNASHRVACTQGYFCPIGSVNQALCPEGFYCSSDASMKFECELGNLCLAGSTKETVCPAGFFCGNTSSQIPCVLGSFCPAGSINQSACPFGYFCSSTDTRLPCPETTEGMMMSCPSGSIAPVALANNSFCAAGEAPKGGVRDIIVWMGGYGIQSMTYNDRTTTSDDDDIGVGGAVELISGTEALAGNVNGVGGVARFNGLSSAVLLPFSTELIVADRSNSVLKRVNFKTKNVTTFLDVIKIGGVSQNIDGTGSSASISFPTDLLRAKHSNIIYVFTPDSIRTVTLSSVSSPALVVGTFPLDGIMSVYGVKPSISGDGKFFIISNYITNLVYKLDTASRVVSTIGSPVNGCKNGVGTDALFDYPSVSVILSNGTRAYISDNFNHGIRILDTDTLAVTSLVGTCPPLPTSSTTTTTTPPIETRGYRISIGFVDAMVLSFDESHLIVLLTYTYGLLRIELTTGYVNPITPSSGSFFAGRTLSLIPNIPPPCIPCAPGSYSLEGLRCDICPEGYFCKSISSSTPLACNLGSFCPAGSIWDSPCAEGSFCLNSSVSLMCEAGSFCPLRSVSPKTCVMRQYCPANSSSAALCPGGSFCKDPSSIKECSIGTYCVPGSTSETACAPGNFCPNASIQLPCPFGSFCWAGFAVPSACPETYYCPDPSIKLICPPGKFCDTGSSVASACVLRQYCPTGSSSSSAIPCPGGSFCKDPSSIKVCSLGAYCPSGSISDMMCPAGSFCENQTSLRNCSSGSHCASGSTSESLCPPGYFCSNPSSIMMPCPRGTFCVAGSTEPAVCQGGTLCNTLGGSAAGVCPPGSFCVEGGDAVICPFHSTSIEGSDSIDDCVCESGLSLFANVSCEVILVAVPVAEEEEADGGGSLWSAGVIAGVVVGSVAATSIVVASSYVLLCVRNNGYSPV